MNRKLQVFISGTYKDLEVERRAAVDAILDAKHIPDGMEFFAAESREQMDVIKQKIRESDVLLILLGARYGSVEPDSGKSYTHLEFLYALEIKKPVIAMVMKAGAVEEWERKNTRDIERNTGDKLEAFKKDVTAKRVASFFDNVDNLQSAILKALVNINENTDLVGWVRRDATVDAAEAYKRLTSIETERDALRSRVQELESRVSAEASSVPAEAEQKRQFKLRLGEDLVMQGEPTFLDWFLRTGRRLTINATLESFQEISETYLKALTGVEYETSRRWEYRTTCMAVLRSFELYGWVILAPSSTRDMLGNEQSSCAITLTERGKSLLLARPLTIKSLREARGAIDSEVPATEAPHETKTDKVPAPESPNSEAAITTGV